MSQSFFYLNKFYFCFFGLFLTIVFWSQFSFANDKFICDKIARQVELERSLPSDILTSIALVEAGRRQKDGSIKSWPWSLNHAGKSLFFENKFEAINYLKKNIKPSFKNIDVGCMQINVKWHREHFESFSSMIDPRTNIEYAAQFLTNLKMAHGSWEKAIKHYHSSTSKLHTKYYAKVAKVWNRKTIDKLSLQQAVLNSDNNSIYFGSMESPDFIFDGYSKKNLDENEQQMLKSTNSKVKNEDNQIYLNAKLIKSNNSYDTEELKRYIKYKSAFLGKNIDMILLFREELSKK